jgi:hypothetical protein
VTRARDFDCMAVGACGIPPFQVGVNGLSAPATITQLGLLLQAGAAITALKLAAAIGTCECATKLVSQGGTSAAKNSRNWAGSNSSKPSAVVSMAVDMLRSLG